jgi:hypothetical protein
VELGRCTAAIVTCLCISGCDVTIARRHDLVHVVPVASWGASDRLEVQCVIGFGQRPFGTTPETTYRALTLNVNPRDTKEMWLRISDYQDSHKPIGNRRAVLTVIQANGSPLVDPTSATIEPTEVVTTSDGFNSDRITLTTHVAGIYRIRVLYKDGQSDAVSYSSPVIALSRAERQSFGTQPYEPRD